MEKKRFGKLLSGEEIINSKQNSLKDLPSGCKDYEPNNSWLEKKQIQAAIETYHLLLGSERIEKKSHLSSAVWNPELGKAKVTKKTGKCWDVFGHSINSEDWLYPEEALFLLETNALELYYMSEDLPLSIEQTYALVIGERCSLSEYRVYSHLSKKGYRILRHDKTITRTPYERNIHLDQMSLAPKRVGENADERNEVKVVEKVSEQLSETAKQNSIELLNDGKHSRNETRAVSPSEEVNIIKIPANNEVDSEPENDGISNDRDKLQVHSPDLIVVEGNKDEDIIEIEDDDDESSDDKDVEITGIRSNQQVISVNLIDSDDDDEEDDVIFISQKGGNDDPSKWRKWFATIEEFANFVPPASEPVERTLDKSTKIKLIDCFDLANKHIDIIMKAIPNQQNGDSLINAPDQRFIPATILPRYSQYKINLFSSSNDQNSEHDYYMDSSNAGNADTSMSLSEISEQNYHSSNYSYGYHRTRSQNSGPHFRRPPWKHHNYHRNNYNGFAQNRERTNFVQNTFNSNNNYRNNFDGPMMNRNNFDGQMMNRNNFDGQMMNRNNFEGQMMNRNWNNCPNPPNVQNTFQFSNSFNNDGGGHSNNPFNLALQQVQQMQMLAMTLMQTSQTLMQQCGGSNQMGNSFNGFSMTGFHDHNRGYRPYRRSYRRRMGGGISRSANHHNHSVERQSPQVTEILSVEDDEELKVKPAIKRAVALGVIANLNAAKRIKFVDGKSDVKIEPVKSESSSAMERRNIVELHQEVEPSSESRVSVNCDKGVTELTPNVLESQVDPMEIVDSPQEVEPSSESRLGVACDVDVTEVTPVAMESQMDQIEIMELPQEVEPSSESRLGVACDVDVTEVTPVAMENQMDQIEIIELPQEVEPSSESRLGVASDADVAEVTPVIIESRIDPMEIVELPHGVESSSESTFGVTSDADMPKDTPSTPPAVQETASDRLLETTTTDTVSLDSSSEQSQPTSMKVVVENVNLSKPLTSINENSNTSSVDPLDVGEGDNDQMRSSLPDTWQSYKMSNHSSSQDDINCKSLLNYGNQRASISYVLKSLQIFEPIEDVKVLRSEIRVAYDLYVPNQPFRKSVQMIPNYRIIISQSTAFPSILELNHLQSIYEDDVPFLYSVVDEDSIRFYRLTPVSLPALDDDSSRTIV